MDRATYLALEAEYRRINRGTVPFNIMHGSALLSIGQHEAAITLHQMALQERPFDAETFALMMLVKDFTPGHSVAEAQADRREWARRFAGPRITGYPNDRNTERPLRVGYVSGDFRAHAAARAFGPVILNNGGNILTAYSTLYFPEDAARSAFGEAFSGWRNVGSLSDRDFCALVREDRIDVLVDLSGHTHGNRLRALSMKPAPVQVTGWGYSTGTGLDCFDGFFSDPVMTPADDRHLYAEPILDLPCVVSAYFPEPLPAVSPLPAASRGFVTFGAVTRLAKITDLSLNLWARVLASVPDSLLIIKAEGIRGEMARERVRRAFAGIDPKRLILYAGEIDWTKHMAVYQDIDICLDPAPHGGGTTAVEALAMGVPTVTLRYPSVTGRLGAAIMTGVDAPNFIAETEDGYVNLARWKAMNTESLAALRNNLRDRLSRSNIGNGVAYCRAVEAHYRALWRGWCKKSLDKQKTTV